MLRRNIKQGRGMRSLVEKVEVLHVLTREDFTEIVTFELTSDWMKSQS